MDSLLATGSSIGGDTGAESFTVRGTGAGTAALNAPLVEAMVVNNAVAIGKQRALKNVA
jgi:hypothetical protein